MAKTLQHRRDVWTEFASEPAADGITTSLSRKSIAAPSAGDESLSLFPNEAVADEVNESRQAMPEALASFSNETASNESLLTRWVVPAAAGVIFGAASLLLTFYLLNRWNQQDLDQPLVMTVADGVPADLASMGRIEVVVPARSGMLLPRPNTTRAPLNPMMRAAMLPPSGTSEPPAGTVVTPAPASGGISLAPEALTRLPGSEITDDDEEAVRRTIRSYEQAYERVDAVAIARLWPTVDQRTLSQAFDAVTSQGIGLESCAIALNGEQATAQCRGRHKFVGKASNSVTIASEQQWLFKMRRADGQWKIEDVSPSQVSTLTAAGRGQN